VSGDAYISTAMAGEPAKWRDSSAGCSWRKDVEELTALERAERTDEERSSFSIPLQ